MKRRPKKQARWQDHYTRQAKKEHFPARSVYKLKEIQNKFRLIKKGDAVLDLGCAPGAWLKYAAQVTGPGGRLVGVDLKPLTEPMPPYVQVLTGDVLEMDAAMQEAVGGGYNVVLSDMAPNTTGIKHVDNARSLNLCMAALELARTLLLPGGHFVCKVFQGADHQELTDAVRDTFGKRKILKPQSSRKASREIFVIGIGKK